MALVKAKMSFYHDAVGTRAMNETFEVKQESLLNSLEKAGYVQRVEGQELQAFEQSKVSEQEVGKRNALTNEAVSLASHVQNQQTLKDQENFAQVRQQASQAAAQNQSQAQQQSQQTTSESASQMAESENSRSAAAKKANK
jgi:hypothetical protein